MELKFNDIPTSFESIVQRRSLVITSPLIKELDIDDKNAGLNKVLDLKKTMLALDAKAQGVSFTYNVFGVEGVGKSSYCTALALLLKQRFEIDIQRIQLEGTVVQKEFYDELKPINDHKIEICANNGITYVRIFPKFVTETELISLIKDKYVFVDGLARLQTLQSKLGERGSNLSALDFGVLQVPYYAKGSIGTFTISNDALRRDIAGTAQGYIEIVSPSECLVVCPFNRRETIRCSWTDSLAVFAGLSSNGHNSSARERMI